MTTDAIYPDELGNVKYHFVISQVRRHPKSPVRGFGISSRVRISDADDACLCRCNCVRQLRQMVCWASSDAVARAGDDAKAVKWMTLQQLRKLHVSQPTSS